MRKLLAIIAISLGLCAVTAMAATKVEPPSDCIICGMNRTTFAQSRMVVTFVDGKSSGTCSIACIATTLQNEKGKKVRSVQVADYAAKSLIDARTAAWVIGGKKPGVMSAVGKWAFAGKAAARAFVRENGGRLATYDEALKEAERESSTDSQSPPHKQKGH